MGESKLSLIDENYWPNSLQQMASEQPLQDPKVLVAQIAHPWGLNSYRQIYTALVPPSMKETILKNPGGIGHEITTSGPHPSPSRGSFIYKPEFSIWSGGEFSEGLEPLVVAWTTGNRTVLLPDQGFLMTYGLVPRTVKSKHGDEIHWDDLQRPLYDVAIVKMVSEYDYELKSEAEIRVDREYLRDYATIRNLSLVQVYYASNTGPMSEADRKTLSGDDVRELKLPGRLLDIRFDSSCKEEIIAQVWGIRDLVDPLNSPITEGRWEYGELKWPGIEGVVTKKISRQLGLKFIHVSDSVLQYYEDHPEQYFVCPENGSVRYQNQWSVSYCHRLSRDIIRLEIKKLYEGCPPDVVKHWNKYAVESPQGNPIDLLRAPNIASRSKKIVYALCDLGDVLSRISFRATGKDALPKCFVRLDRREMDYCGWWNISKNVLIARHIPLNLVEKEFLNRCLNLRSLIVDGINEANLRRIIVSCMVNDEDMKELKSLKLLDILVQHAQISLDTGLSIFNHSKEIEKIRLKKIKNLKPDQFLESPMSLLFVLNDLRIAAAHPEKNIEELLEIIGSDRSSVQSGFGLLLDEFYDSIATALEETIILLNDVLDS